MKKYFQRKKSLFVNFDNRFLNKSWPVLSWLLISIYLMVGLYTLPYSPYLADQAEHFSRSLDYIMFEDITPLGPVISGTKAYIPGPAYYLLLSFPLIIYKSPFSSLLLIILFHSLAMVMWEIQGQKIGLDPKFRFFMILMGGFSWVSIEFSSHIWNPNFLYILTTLIFISFLKVKNNNTSIWWTVLLPVTSVLPQFHLTGIIYWPLIIIICILYRIKPKGKWLIIGVLSSLLVWLPYLSYEIKTSFHNTKLLYNPTAEKHSLINMDVIFNTIVGNVKNCTLEESDHEAPVIFYTKLIDRIGKFSDIKELYFSFIDILCMFSFLTTIVFLFAKKIKSTDELFLASMGISLLLINVFFLSFANRSFLPHYALASFVGTSVLIAIGMRKILRGVTPLIVIPWIFLALSYFPYYNPYSIQFLNDWVREVEKNIPEGTISSFTPVPSLKGRFGSLLKGFSNRYKKEAGDWLVVYNYNLPIKKTIIMWKNEYELNELQFKNAKKKAIIYKRIKPNHPAK